MVDLSGSEAAVGKGLRRVQLSCEKSDEYSKTTGVNNTNSSITGFLKSWEGFLD
jgi:hypothetical protein